LDAAAERGFLDETGAVVFLAMGLRRISPELAAEREIHRRGAEDAEASTSCMINCGGATMKFIVDGADRETGEDISVTIETTDAAAAGLRANKMGMMVTKVTAAREPAPAEKKREA
jgi:hypothetical protein